MSLLRHLLYALVLCLLTSRGSYAWIDGMYNGELFFEAMQVITGCTMSDYKTQQHAFNITLKDTIAGTLGLSKMNISSFHVFVSQVTFPAIEPNVTVFYRIKATNEVDFELASNMLLGDVIMGTFDNLLHLFAKAHKSHCLQQAKSGPLILISLVPTDAPTPYPTPAPTPFTGKLFISLLNRYWIATTVVSSILGILILYYGGWGAYYLYDWWKRRNLRLISQLESEVNFHDKKLQQRFVNTNVAATPHTSKMRENFNKQFGYMPSADDSLNKMSGESSEELPTSLTNLSAGAGTHAASRTLATRLVVAKASKSPTSTRAKPIDVEMGNLRD
jgi:hypothetical protein